MFYLNGLDSNLENIVSLAKFRSSHPIVDRETLKAAYKSSLLVIQPNVRQNISDKFIYDNDLISHYLSKYVDTVNDKSNSASVHEYTSNKSMECALKEIKKGIVFLKNNCPSIHFLFELVVNSIFYWRSEGQGGGSTSNAVGVIWASNRKNWGYLDVVEFLVHELTHQLMFLDELRYGHYKDCSLLNNSETYALSAILCRRRPMDKVIHSLVVGFEVLSLRQDLNTEKEIFLVHPESEQLKEDCKATIESIYSVDKKNNFLTKRSLEVVEDVCLKINRL